MKKIILIIVFMSCIVCTTAQSAKPTDASDISFAGTWSLVSIENVLADGTHIYPYGIEPKGLMVFDKSGNYSLQILNPSCPKIATGDKNTATPEEYKALVQGANSHFGKYEADPVNQTLTFRIEYSSFPNWEGTTQKRMYSLRYDQLKYIVKNTTQGGKDVIAEVLWKRVL
jgi:hypothetical protein